MGRKLVVVEPDADGLAMAADALRSGRLVAFPTDTFFALGANALDAAAVSQLFTVKGRAEANPVPVLLAAASDVGIVASEFPDGAKRLADRFWPGALTIVLPARANVPGPVTAGTGTVGVRVPGHETARKLIGLAGVPVTGTSANRSGQPPCKTAAQVLEQLKDVVQYVLNAPCGEHSAPSTVVSVSGGAIKIIREGSIGRREIEEALKLT
jgi:L-threonylcarbamoyladenylate synthase